MGEMVNFTKNVARAGACLMMMEVPKPWNDGVEPWDLEVDDRNIAA